MTVVEETQVLRTTVRRWAADPEWSLLCKYDLLRDKQPVTFGDKLFRWCKTILAGLGVVPPHLTKYVWLCTLKHSEPVEKHQVLLIWALGASLNEQRAALEGFMRRLDPASGIVPVLVTDIADFAYYSRLKWLIEYVPELSGAGPSYHERKKRYLAWRYREALVVPLSAGIAKEVEWNEVMELRS